MDTLLTQKQIVSKAILHTWLSDKTKKDILSILAWWEALFSKKDLKSLRKVVKNEQSIDDTTKQYLIDLFRKDNENTESKPDWHNDSVADCLEQYGLAHETALKNILYQKMEDAQQRHDAHYQWSSQKPTLVVNNAAHFLTMGELVQSNTLHKARNCGWAHRNKIKDFVVAYCTDKNIEIPQYRTLPFTILNDQWKPVLDTAFIRQYEKERVKK